MTAETSTPEKAADQPKSSTQPSGPANVKLVAIIVVVLVLAAVGVVSAQYLFADPKKILADAFKKTAAAQSVSLNARSDDEKFMLTGDLHKEDSKLSQLKLALNDLDNKPNEDLTLGLKANKTDLYVDMSYSNIDSVVGELSSFSYMKTYQLVYPVLKGQKSVHISIPEAQALSKTTTKNLSVASPSPVSEKTKKQFEDFGKKLQEAVIIRKFDRSIDYKGKNYQRVTIGLDKVKLVAALESLKDMDIEVKVSQINAMIKVVNAVNNWDSDLVEIYVKDGYVSVLALSLPEIPEAALKEGLEESAKDNPSLDAILKNSTDKVESLFKPKKPGELTKIGTLELTNYNSAPAVEKPTAVVEFNDILENAKVEVLPLLGPMLGTMMGAPTMQQTPPLNIPKIPSTQFTPPKNFEIPSLPKEP